VNTLFEKINQHAMVWVKDMMAELHTDDPHKALHALRAGLHAVRDLLTVDGAAHLSAQLPLLIRGMYFEAWDPAHGPLRIRHTVDFLPLVREKYAPRADAPADDIIVALFRVLDRHVSAGEITKLFLSLPEELVQAARGRGARSDSD
jgi:uncharacterized protein (DUF2267 family)